MKLQLDDLDLVLQKVNKRNPEENFFMKEPEDSLGNHGNCQQIKTEFVMKDDSELNQDPIMNVGESDNGEIDDKVVKMEDEFSLQDVHFQLKVEDNVDENGIKEMFPCKYCNMTLTRNRDLQTHIQKNIKHSYL